MTKFAAGLLVLASWGCWAAPKPQAQVTQGQVDSWLRLWQGRLALDDWRVEAQIVRQSDLNADTLG
ncbi:MAG: hypothetical protein ABSB67_22255, partial [Bryobacteraceae bacterium]